MRTSVEETYKPIPFWPEVQHYTHQSKMPSPIEDSQIKADEKSMFKAVQLEIGQTYDVKVSHVANGPDEFFVQLVESLPHLNAMTRKTNSQTQEPLREPAVTGTVCLGSQTHPVKQLGRAVLYSPKLTSTKVYFVDHGHSEVLTYDKIYKLPADLAKDSLYAIKLTLSGTSDWTITQDLKNYFRDLVLGKNMHIKVCEGPTTPQIQYCQMYLRDQSVADMITRAFPEACNCLRRDESLESDEYEDWDKELEEANSPKATATWEKENWDKELEESNSKPTVVVNISPTDFETSSSFNEVVVHEEEDWDKELEESNSKLTVAVNISPTDVETSSSFNEVAVYEEEDWDKELEEASSPKSTLITTIPPAASPQIWTTFRGFVVHYHNATMFYIQRRSYEFADLMDKISTDCKKCFKVLPESEIVPGLACVAQYSKDSQWYRAVVKSVENSLATVYFVDYGNSETVSLSKIQEIDPDLLQLPAQALQCQIYNSKTTWTVEENQGLRDFLMESEVKVEFVSEKNGMHQVLFREIRSGNSKYVFINGFFAGGIKEEDPRAEPTEISSRNPSVTGSGYFSLKEEDTEVTEIIKPSFKIPLVSVETGAILNGIMVHFQDSDSFYIRPDNPECDCLMNNMTLLYEKNDKIISDFDINPGLLCVAQYSVDLHWYRAVVQSADSWSATVYFVDYGNTETVSYSNIREIDPDFLQLPAQAMRCQLFCVKKSWTADETENLEKLLVESELEVEFVSENNGTYQVLIREILSDHTRSDYINSRFARGVDMLEAEKSWASSTSDLSESDGFSCDDNWETLTIIIPPATVEAGVPFNAVPSYYYDPTRLYLRRGLKNTQFDNFNTKINTHYEKYDKILSKSEIVPGLFCVAQYSEDRQWYRAVVESVEGLSATVYFIDYGNSETVSLSKIKPIVPDFAQLPAQAIQCQLFCHAKLWTKDESDLLYEQLYNKNLEVTAVYEENGIYHVLIKEILSANVVSDNVNVQFFDVPDPRPEVIATENWEETIDAEEDWEKTNSVEKSLAINIPLATAEVGVPFNAVPTYYYDPSRFYVRRGPNNTQFETQQAEINVTYKKYNKILSKSEIVPGLFCVAQYSEDRQWYRAVVESVEGLSATVYFIDYGNSETVSLSKIKQIELEFAQLPAQAIQCQLFCHAKLWTKDESDLLYEQLYTKNLEVTAVYEENGKYHVLIKEILSAGVVSDYVNVQFFDVPDPKPKVISTENWEETIDAEEDWEKTNSVEKSLAIDIPLATAEVGVPFNAVPTYYYDPSRFYVRRGPNNTQFETQQAEINVTYKKYNKILSKSEIVPGLFCVAQYSEDRQWYRAVVESVGSSGAKVYFVDYGNSETVDFSKIKEVKPEFTQLAAQAIQCQLFCHEKLWTKDESNSLYEQLFNKNLEVKAVYEENGTYHVLIKEILSVELVSDYINVIFVDVADLEQQVMEFTCVTDENREKTEWGNPSSESDYFSGEEGTEDCQLNSRSQNKIDFSSCNVRGHAAHQVSWY